MLYTTEVAVDRRAGTGDPYEADAAGRVVASMPAHVSDPNAADLRVGGAQEVIDAVLLAPVAVPVERADTVTDLRTGDVWRVTWRQLRRGLGLDHQRAGLVRVAGAANG